MWKSVVSRKWRSSTRLCGTIRILSIVNNYGTQKTSKKKASSNFTLIGLIPLNSCWSRDNRSLFQYPFSVRQHLRSSNLHQCSKHDMHHFWIYSIGFCHLFSLKDWIKKKGDWLAKNWYRQHSIDIPKKFSILNFR